MIIQPGAALSRVHRIMDIFCCKVLGIPFTVYLGTCSLKCISYYTVVVQEWSGLNTRGFGNFMFAYIDVV